MSSQDVARLAVNFRHALLYLIREAYSAGFGVMGKSLEEAEKTIDEELSQRGISPDIQSDEAMTTINTLKTRH